MVFLKVKTRLSLWSLWIVSLSFATFVLYGFDKASSARQGQRVPEKALHALNLAGGFLGGLAGRALFRHKTTKPSFLAIPLIAAALHAVAWFFL